MTKRERLKEIRQAFADFAASTGCGCCGDPERKDEALNKIGKLLRMKKYSDGSGYDYRRYRSK